MKSYLVKSVLITALIATGVSGTEMKKIEFIKGRVPQTSDIPEIESIIGKELPEWYRDFYMRVSGLNRGPLSEQELSSDSQDRFDFIAHFEDGGADGDYISGFLTVDQVKEQWPYIDYIEERIEHFEISKGFVQWENLIPIAGTGDGALYVAIGGDHDRAVFEADNGDYGVGRVSDDVGDFISELGITVVPE